MTDEQKRQYVSNLYSAKRWKKRVAGMSDNMIVAIYRDHQKDPTPKPKSHYVNLPEEPQPIVPAEKLNPRDPHWNEDDFPLI